MNLSLRQQRIRIVACTALGGMVLCLLDFAALGVWHSPGLKDDLLICVLHMIFVGIFSPLALLYMGWITAGVAVGACGEWKVKPWYSLAMLAPAILGGGFALWRLATDPPSPNTYFRRFFLANLPTDAQNLRVRPSAAPDVGIVAYYFHCSPSSTRRLIEETKVKEVPWKEIGEDYLVDMPHWRLGHEGVTPDPAQWLDRRQYLWRDGKTGTEHYIITNGAMTEVFVSRYPFASKDDDELGPEAAAKIDGEGARE